MSRGRPRLDRRLVACAGLALLGVAAVCLPPLLTVDPLRQDLADALAPPFSAYGLGADHLGRSVLARLIFGARMSLGIAGAAVAVALVIGGGTGVAAAALGGWFGQAVRVVVDTALALPAFLIALLVAGSLATGPLGLAIVLAATMWVEPCRVSLLTAARARGALHVQAARLAGLDGASVIARLIVPALLGPLASVGGLMFGQAVLTIASLGFLGLGLRPPTPEWGAMIVDALPYIDEAPGLVVAPSAAIMLTVILLFVASGRTRP